MQRSADFGDSKLKGLTGHLTIPSRVLMGVDDENEMWMIDVHPAALAEAEPGS